MAALNPAIPEEKTMKHWRNLVMASVSRLFPPSRPSKQSKRAWLRVDRLEDRLAPALLLSYSGPGSVLRLAETSLGNDTLTIAEQTAGTIHFDLGKATFDPNSSSTGVTYSSGKPGASSGADVSIALAGAIRTMLIDLGSGTDTLSLSMTNADNAVGGISVMHSGSSGYAAITLNSLNLIGDLDINAGPITVAAGATVVTNSGNLTLMGLGEPNINGGVGVEIDGATLDGGVNSNLYGSIHLTGSGASSQGPNGAPGAADSATGIDVRGGAKVQAEGSGAITLNGTGASGLDDNSGVIISGTGTAITTAGGDINITGVAGISTGDANDGVDVLFGATVQAAAGNVTLSGGSNGGADQNVGVYLDGAQTVVSTVGGNLAITGVGTGSGVRNYGIDVEGGATVSAGGNGSLSLEGQAPVSTPAITFNGFDHGSGNLQSGSGAVQLAGDSIDLGAADSITTTNGSVLFFNPLTTSLPIDVGSAFDQPGALTFTPTDCAAIAQGGPNGFSQITIGGDGLISTATNLLFNTNLILQSPVAFGEGLDITDSIDVGIGHSLELLGGPVVVSGASTKLLTHGGNLTVDGTGTPGFNGGIGVEIDGATLDCGTGSLNVAGMGTADPLSGSGSKSSGNFGGPGDGSSAVYGLVVFDAGKLQSEGSGTITLNGTGGSGTDNNIGVFLTDAGTAVTTVDGSLSITGIGQGSGLSNLGIDVESGALIKAQGNGTVTVNGTGGNGTNDNSGVFLSDTGTAVTTAGGNLTITGTGQGSGQLNCGIDRQYGAAIQAGGSGTLTLIGTGANGTDVNIGVLLLGSGATVMTAAADLSITGIGLGGGIDNFGIEIEASATVTTSGAGNLTLKGQAPGDTPAITFNPFGSGSGFLQSGNGAVTLIGDVIDLGAPNTIRTTGSSQLFFEPFTPSQPIDLGDATDQAGSLTFTPADSAAMAQGGPNGFSQITIGRPDGTGLMSTAADLTFQTAVTLQSPGANSNGLSIGNNLDVSSHALTLLGGPVVVGMGAALTTDGGDLTVCGNGGTGIEINAATLDSGTNGNLRVTGSSAGGTGVNDGFGVNVLNGARVQAEGTGTITLKGTGTGTNSYGFEVGVEAFGAGTLVTTAGGNLSITGSVQGYTRNTFGVAVASGAVVQAGGSGTLTLNGTGSNGSSYNLGVWVDAPGTAVSTTGGNLSITGNAQGSNTLNFGIDIEDSATLRTVGAGNLTLEGQSSGQTPAITNGFGFNFASGLLQSGSGDVTFIGDVIDLGTANTVTTTGGSRLFFKPFTFNRPIDLGNATDQAGALTFTPMDLNAISAGLGFSQITFGGVNIAGLISVGASLVFQTAVTLRSPGNGISVDAYLDVMGHALTLLGGPVDVGAGGTLTTDGGTLTITGVGTATVNGGIGVTLIDANLDSGVNGNLNVTGSGAAGTNSAHGVALFSATVEAEGSGTIVLKGNGGNGTNVNNGVLLFGSGTAVTTAGGNLTITGNGEGNGSNNSGVVVGLGAVVQVEGAGTLTLHGNGANGTDDNLGVSLFLATAVTTTGGNLSITGNGKGSGQSNYGIEVSSGAVVQAGGSGTLTLIGNGGNGTDGNFGVYLTDPNTAVTTAGGNLSVTGNGKGNGQSNFGIEVGSGAVARAGGSGALVLIGNGSTGTDGNLGVYLTDPNTEVGTARGNLSITGNGKGNGQLDYGIDIAPGAVVQAGGSGTLTLKGTGGNGTSNNVGVLIFGADTSIITSAGNLSITGAGNGRGIQDFGIDIEGSAAVRTIGGGRVTLQGKGPGDTPAITFNGFGTGSGLLQAGGDVMLIGDVIDLGAVDSLASNDNSQLFFRPLTANRPIDLGSAADLPGALTFKLMDIAAVTAGPQEGLLGFSQITIGRPDGTGLVRTFARLVFNAALTIESPGQNSQGLLILNSINTGAGHALTLLGGPIHVGGVGTQLRTHGGTLSITGFGKASINGGVGVDIDAATLDSGPNGDLNLAGNGADGTHQAIGIEIVNGASVLTGATGTLILNGTGGNGTDGNYGVVITGPNTTVATRGGNLSITGTGQGSGSFNIGIFVLSCLVQASGEGTLTLTGTAGDGTNENVGILSNGVTTVQTLGGDLYLTGTGQGSGSLDDGIELLAGGLVKAGGNGSVHLDGLGASANFTSGVYIDAGAHIFAGASGGANYGLALNSGSTVCAALDPSNASGFGYAFIRVDGMANLGGATLELEPAGTIVPGMTFLILNVSNDPITGSFALLANPDYQIAYSNTAVTVTCVA
jgi:hypothetical protein